MNEICNGHLLLVGDGDFSFSKSLLQNSSLQPSQITTSNLDTEATILQHSLAAASMNFLRDSGVTVLLEVDARELHTHPVISQKKYDRVIFNFPLADRHNIKKNRALIGDFFTSCGQLLTEVGEIMITLCKGQGGSPADQPMRSWHNSWQVVAMAANSGFLLRSILPFDASQYPGYHSVGFRFQDKSFNTEGALTHIFSQADSVVIEQKSTRGILEVEGDTFSCTRYLAEKMKRNLLKEEWNPVKFTSQVLKEALSLTFQVNDTPLPDPSMLITGHKSLFTVKENEKPFSSSEKCMNQNNSNDSEDAGGAYGADSEFGASSNGSNSATDSSLNDVEMTDLAEGEDYVKNEKDEKNRANLSKVVIKSSRQLAHGHESAEVDKTATQNQNRERKLTENLSSFLPLDSENVCVLIKKNLPSALEGHVAENDEQKEGTDNEQAQCEESEPSRNEMPVNTMVTTQAGVGGKDEGNCVGKSPKNDVCHLRVSLLETLPQIISEVKSRIEEALCVDLACLKTSQIVEGQCAVPCRITTTYLPVRHELLIIEPIAPTDPVVSQSANPKLDKNLSKACSGIKFSSFENIVQSLTSGLDNSCLLRDKFCVEFENISESHALVLQGTDRISDLHLLNLKAKSDGTEDMPRLGLPIGYLCQVNVSELSYFIAVLNLDNIASQVFDLPDARLLWSLDPRFLQKSEPNHLLSTNIFQPPSLYPMKYVHDVSFWVTDSDFDGQEMLDIIRSLGDDLVVGVSIQDEYSDPEGGRLSKCYRLHFLSYDKALSYSTSWKLQSFIRLEIAKRLKVTLR